VLGDGIGAPNFRTGSSSGYIEQMFYTFNRYTMKKTENGGTTVYAFLLSWPEDPVLKLGAPIPSPNTVHCGNKILLHHHHHQE
jgi:hypothetical protein